MSSKTRHDFIERSIMGALSFLKNALFADEYALKRGFFQDLDPRIKLVSILLLLVLVLVAKDIQLLFLIYLFCLILVTISSISLVYFFKRTWFFVPFFTIIIAMPALFSTVTPGHAVWAGKFLGWDLIVTRQGIDSASIFFMRVLTSVSLSILLILTTRHFVLLKVLRLFNLPQIFVMTLGMCYRYIYLFIEIVQNMYLAIKSRVGFISSSRKGQKVVAWNMAGLWWRSYQMQNDVYLAMVSRGYDGEPKVVDKFTARGKDWGWLIVVVIIFVAGLCSTHYLN